MEFWGTGVLRTVGIAPRLHGVGGAAQAEPFLSFLCLFLTDIALATSVAAILS